MAKGQLKGNRETKKPKQAKNPVVPVAPGGTLARVGAQTNDAKKK